MQTSMSLLGSIETVVDGGKAVVSAGSSIIIAMMQEALKNGRSATFYVSPAQAEAVMRWYWTPKRVKEIGMEAVSQEERAKIETELGVKDMGTWFSNRIQCSCGAVYGGFEFIEEGLREHGKDWVGAIVELKNTAVIRINPAQNVFCARCKQKLIIGHYYFMPGPRGTLDYACCGGEI